jgi:hypothetical protein
MCEGVTERAVPRHVSHCRAERSQSWPPPEATGLIQTWMDGTGTTSSAAVENSAAWNYARQALPGTQVETS